MIDDRRSAGASRRMNATELDDVSRVLSRAEIRRYRRQVGTVAEETEPGNANATSITRAERRRIVRRAYETSDDARRTIARVAETVELLRSALGGRPKTAVYEFLATLDDRSLALLEYCWHNEHASIRELTALIDADTDCETLTVIRERLNRVARRTLGAPVLEFERRGIDSRTGAVVTFEWWFAGECRAGDGSDLERLRAEGNDEDVDEGEGENEVIAP